MGLEMWFRDDIRNMLLSLTLSTEAAGQWAGGAEADAYRAGYQAAIGTVAVAFGVSPAAVAPNVRLLRQVAPALRDGGSNGLLPEP